MVKTTFVVLLLALFAGAAAGMAVQLLNAPEQATGDRPTERQASDARLTEALQIVARLENDLEDLRLEVDSQRTRNDDLAKELADVREAATAPENPLVSEDGHTIDLGKAMKGQLIGKSGRPFMFGGKATPGMKIAALPEDEKWAKLREDLSLDSYQEEQLKDIATAYRDSFKDLFKPGEDGKITLGKLDLGKMMKAKTDADEKVKNLLSADQYKKYNDGGYGAAVGLGGGTTSVAITTSFGSSEGK